MRVMVSALLFLAAAAVAVSVNVACLAADYMAGMRAYEAKDYETALRELQPLAEAGDALAQYRIGVMYLRAHGAVKDEAEAVRWFREAAGRGHKDARFNLAYMLANGTGVAKDEAEAARLFRIMIEEKQGDIEAEIIVYAIDYFGGRVPANWLEGAKWLRQEAEKGVPEAQFLTCAVELIGHRRDEQGVGWCRRAAANGFSYAQWNLGKYYEQGTGVKADLSEALKWYRLAAENGDGRAQFELARRHLLGVGLGKDIKEAVKWAGKGAQQGHPDAQALLGLLYFKGRGVERDAAKALDLLRQAANRNSAPAQAALASFYLHGRGVGLDIAEAHKWMILAQTREEAKEIDLFGDSLLVEEFSRVKEGLNMFASAEQTIEGFRRAWGWRASYLKHRDSKRLVEKVRDASRSQRKP
ncbi:MAG: hypothetical protein QF511_08560 [Rhodospirillales bacterium]|nr:hypothetical protein [Rhodospirillales bacterium]HJP55142.1 SEL1-like repeat protein [Rhodospirillales bacterium]